MLLQLLLLTFGRLEIQINIMLLVPSSVLLKHPAVHRITGLERNVALVVDPVYKMLIKG